MKRRNFFSLFGLSWLTSLFPIALSSCSSQKGEPSAASSNTPPTPKTSVRPDGYMSVGSVETLDRTGFLAVKISDKSAIVLRDSVRPNSLRAFNLTCTHAGCLVDWESKDKVFTCPCHDSQFSSDGKVRQGPALKPLQTYLAKLEGNTIFVNVNS